MATVVGLLVILVLFFVVPFVLVVTFVAARARRQLRQEERAGEAPLD